MKEMPIEVKNVIDELIKGVNKILGNRVKK